MDDALSDENVTIAIRKAEALVLFELLADINDQSVLELHDNADKLALARLHGRLETALVEPFARNYAQLIEQARAQLCAEYGED